MNDTTPNQLIHFEDATTTLLSGDPELAMVCGTEGTRIRPALAAYALSSSICNGSNTKIGN